MKLDEFEQTILVGNLSRPTFLVEGILQQQSSQTFKTVTNVK
jgi:hypothetical protein